MVEDTNLGIQGAHTCENNHHTKIKEWMGCAGLSTLSSRLRNHSKTVRKMHARLAPAVGRCHALQQHLRRMPAQPARSAPCASSPPVHTPFWTPFPPHSRPAGSRGTAIPKSAITQRFILCALHTPWTIIYSKLRFWFKSQMVYGRGRMQGEGRGQAVILRWNIGRCNKCVHASCVIQSRSFHYRHTALMLHDSVRISSAKLCTPPDNEQFQKLEGGHALPRP